MYVVVINWLNLFFFFVYVVVCCDNLCNGNKIIVFFDDIGYRKLFFNLGNFILW